MMPCQTKPDCSTCHELYLWTTSTLKKHKQNLKHNLNRDYYQF